MEKIIRYVVFVAGCAIALFADVAQSPQHPPGAKSAIFNIFNWILSPVWSNENAVFFRVCGVMLIVVSFLPMSWVSKMRKNR